MRYRRTYVPGGSYFFTVVTAHRRPLFSDEANVNVLRSSFRKIRQQRPLQIDAIAVLPDHLHCIWQLPKKRFRIFHPLAAHQNLVYETLRFWITGFILQRRQ